MEKYDVIPIFPSPLYVAEIDSFTPQELRFVHRTDLYSKYENTDGILVGSDRFDILQAPELYRIKSFIQTHLNNYASNVMCVDNELFPTIAWLNRTKKGAYHYQHHHVNSIASGVLYFTDDPAPIEFHTNQTCAWSTLKVFPKNYNQFNTHSNIIEVKKGTLIIFPSYLEHSVIRTTNDLDRISLSFNTWISGTIGLLNQTSYLNLDSPTLVNEPKDNLNILNERKKFLD
jgi:uncharacterized protein (TIGR02466 family)